MPKEVLTWMVSLIEYEQEYIDVEASVINFGRMSREREWGGGQSKATKPLEKKDS